MQEVLIFASILSPVVLGLVEVVKQVAKFPNNYVPLVAVLVGVAVGFAAEPFTALELTSRLWAGGMAGLAATGLYELVTPSTGQTKK